MLIFFFLQPFKHLYHAAFVNLRNCSFANAQISKSCNYLKMIVSPFFGNNFRNLGRLREYTARSKNCCIFIFMIPTIKSFNTLRKNACIFSEGNETFCSKKGFLKANFILYQSWVLQLQWYNVITWISLE